MNSQLNYPIARQRITELACRADQARRASHARAASSASQRRYTGFLLVPRRLKGARVAAAQQTNHAWSEHCLRCEP